MKAGWEESKIEELCFIGDGNHSSNYPTKEEMIADGVPFIRSTNISNGIVTNFDIKFISKEKHIKLKKGHLKTGDVLITNRGEIGKTAIVDSRFDGANLNSQIAWLRCNESIFNRYLFYFLNSNIVQQHFKNSKSGAALQQFTIKQIKELKIAHPNYVEQQRIVAILDQAFEGIAKARANAQQNLQNARALFESHLHSVFNQRGEGWVEKTLGELCVFTQGIQRDVNFQSETQGENQVRFLRIVDFTQGNEPPRYIDFPGDKYILNTDDVSLVRYGASTGFVCRGLKGALANNLFRVIPKSLNKLTNDFLFIYLQSPIFQNVIKVSMNGAAMPAISFGLIEEIPFPLPSHKDQQTIVCQLDALRTETQKLEAVYQKKIANLGELKKSLLQQAFAGEL